MLKKFKMFVYKELESLASVDTKSVGGMGLFGARLLVERVPLIYALD